MCLWSWPKKKPLRMAGLIASYLPASSFLSMRRWRRELGPGCISVDADEINILCLPRLCGVWNYHHSGLVFHSFPLSHVTIYIRGRFFLNQTMFETNKPNPPKPQEMTMPDTILMLRLVTTIKFREILSYDNQNLAASQPGAGSEINTTHNNKRMSDVCAKGLELQ